MSQSATTTSVVNSHQPVFVLIDGHSLAFRSYYAFAKSKKGALRTSKGISTSICFGFLNSLLQVIESEQPEYLAIANSRFNLSGHKNLHQLFEKLDAALI